MKDSPPQMSSRPSRMQIATVDFVVGAQAARGITVVIDVFRAFSLAAQAFSQGAAAIIPVGEIAAARQLKAAHPDYLLVGERQAKPLPGADCGNSPTQLQRLDLRGKTIIHTTHAGTQGLVNAIQADEVITGALVNAAAIARFIRARDPQTVTLVRMGHEARERCDEDDACAALLAARLRDEQFDAAGIRARLRQSPNAARFFDPQCDWMPQEDFELCTEVDRFDFVLRLDRSQALPVLRRVA